MMQEILELSTLYNDTKKAFREVKLKRFDEETTQYITTIDDMKQYFDRLLDIIPKDVSINVGDRLTISFEKSFYYDTKETKNNVTPIVLIDDKYSSQKHYVLDKEFDSLCFGYGDEKTEFIHVDTLEYMVMNWNEIKKLVNFGIIEELYRLLDGQLQAIMDKIQFLETLNNWRA
jgi:hypothetical protein